ncbi:MAG: permease [Candidatus Thermoplasmatota archaeon]|nr:permease [Candidatus Thermoplasmatota archaeon]
MDEAKIDPICGMKGTIPAHGHYFCSKGCIQKYEQQHNLSPEIPCPSCSVPAKKWYKERLYQFSLLLVFLAIITYVIPQFNPFFYALKDYALLIWWAVLLGFLIGGIIDYFIPRQYIEKYLSRHKKRTIVYAVIFGFLMSACSHGILAIAIALYRKGAATSSVVAFLLAAPWANLPITILLFGFFGWKALVIVLSALLIAILTGLIYQALERKSIVECQQCSRGEDQAVLTEFSIIQDVRKRWHQFNFTRRTLWEATRGTLKGSWSLTKMVMWWLIIGMLLAAVVRTLVNTGILTHDLFHTYMGPTPIGLLVTLFFATIIEVCSEGSSPLAFEIYTQTRAFGNSVTFLMAGVSTDVTEIGLIWSNIGRKAAVWLPLLTVPQVLIVGFLCNMFLSG